MSRQSVSGHLRSFLATVTPIKWTTPIDVSAHQSEVCRRLMTQDDSPYTKVFEFPAFDLEAIEREARCLTERLKEVPEEIRALVEDKVQDAVERSRVIHSRSDAAFSAWEELHNGLPNQAVLDQAESILAEPPELRDDGRLGNRIQAPMAIRGALDNYGLHEWTVTIEPNMATEASVNGLTRTIRVRQGSPQDYAMVRRLVVHEVGGHVLRWENAWRQSSQWVAFPFGNSVPTEEGLAVLLEDQLSVSTGDTMRKYAARVVAVASSRARNMMELARDLHLHMSPADAAALTLRIRRGLTRTDSLGGSTKDHGYLSGLLALRRLSHEDLQLLRSAKWPLAELRRLRHMAEAGDLAPPVLVASSDLLGARAACPYGRSAR